MAKDKTKAEDKYEKKRKNIRTLNQEPEKKETPSFEKEITGEKPEPEETSDVQGAGDAQDGTAVKALVAAGEDLLDHPGFDHDGDDTHPLAIAKKTLPRCIDRLRLYKWI